MPDIIHLDWETYSSQPLGKTGKVPGVGAFRYANDSSCEILMAGMALNDSEPIVWVNPRMGVTRSDKDQSVGNKLFKQMSDPKTLIYAHNAPFEVAVTIARFLKDTGWKPPHHSQFRCTMAMARKAALPPKLETLAKVLGLPEQKDTKGKALIRKFCCPQKERVLKPTTNPKLIAKRAANPFRPRIKPESAEEIAEFKQFIEYCAQDVKVEQMVHSKLKYFELTGDDLATFLFDMDMNVRGLPVNLTALKHASKIIEDCDEEIGAEFYELTGINHTQNAKFLAWLQIRGWAGTNLQADTLDEELEGMDFDPTTEVGQALTMKKQLGYAAVKKVMTMLRMAGPRDNRVRGTLVYHGAGPGRWTGSGVQPQNFKRPSQKLVENMPFEEQGYKDADSALTALTGSAYRAIEAGATKDELELCYGPALEVVSSCIRHFIHDKNQCRACGGVGCHHCVGLGFVESKMLSSDFAAVEARIVCGLAGEEGALQEYREGVDRYKRMASVIFKVPVDKVNKYPQRFVGKQAILGCGYQMSGAKFRITVENYGYMELEEGMENVAVKAFRETHPNIVKLWASCEKGARDAIKNQGQTFKAGPMLSFKVIRTAGIKFLAMKLPSGRQIVYPSPRLEPCLRYINKGKQVQQINPTQEQIDKAVNRVGKSERYGDSGYTLKDVVTFYGQEGNKAQWTRIQTYGGKLVENATQGTAADYMAHGAINAEKHGYKMATLIHDEALSYYAPEKGQTIEELSRLLTEPPVWGGGIPIEAEGEVVSYYTK